MSGGWASSALGSQCLPAHVLPLHGLTCDVDFGAQRAAFDIPVGGADQQCDAAVVEVRCCTSEQAVSLFDGLVGPLGQVVMSAAPATMVGCGSARMSGLTSWRKGAPSTGPILERARSRSRATAPSECEARSGHRGRTLGRRRIERRGSVASWVRHGAGAVLADVGVAAGALR